MTNVLVIRPLQEAQRLSDLLNNKKIASTLYPLYKPVPLPLGSFEKPQALIVTSKNALNSLEEREDLKSLPLYVVGSQTAFYASTMGFSNVRVSALTSDELVNLIRADTTPDKGSLIYFSGEIINGEIVEKLAAHGFNITRYIVYRLEDETELPLALRKDLASKHLTHVMFFSPRTTKVFVELLKKEGLEMIVSNMISLCLSQNVAEEAKKVKWSKIWIAPRPTTQALIGYFDEVR